MMNAIRAEFRKIYTVRSTYGTFIISVLLVVALAGFWIYGYQDVERAAQNDTALRSVIGQAVGLGSFLMAFIALLSVGHEYRYNTILYGLTTTNRRFKIFLSKFMAVLVVSTAAVVLLALLTAIAFYIGQNLASINTAAQVMPDLSFVWRSLLSAAGTISLAYLIAMLVRSQIMSIAVFLIVPMFVEGLLTLLLKDNIKYLPFTALSNLVVPEAPVAYTTSALIVAAYVGGLGLVAWVLFSRRDAN